MRKDFKINIEIPTGMTVADMKEFIHDAVSSWGKQYQPLVDPRFDIGDSKITVTQMIKREKKNVQHNSTRLTEPKERQTL